MLMNLLRLLDPGQIDPFAYEQGNLAEIRKHSLLGNGSIGWNYPMDYSFVAMMFDELSKQGKVKPGMKFIDIGCGPGAIHGYLEEKYGIKIVGIDMKRWPSDYVDLQGDFLDTALRKGLGVKPNSIDAFISVSALEHLPTPKNRQVIKLCKECLKPGGFLLATAAIAEIHETFADQTNYTKKEIESIYGGTFEPYDYKAVFSRWRKHRDIVPAYMKRYKKNALAANEPNFLTFGYAYVKPLAKRVPAAFLPKVEDYRNYHKGQRCFVVGNGPSLRKTNLELMFNDVSIGMNRIALIYKDTSWRPSYYSVMTDNISKETWRVDAVQSVNEGIPSFVSAHYRKFFEQSNVHFLSCKGHGDKMPSYPDSYWSHDITKGVTKYGSTILVSLEIAVYMGFKEIYLIGCDLGFQENCGESNSGSDKNHFSADYGTPGCPGHILNHNMHQSHVLAKRMAERAGTKIYNATVGGNLKVYERVNYEELF
ncbi:MAG: methyltransferase domain-containing protein [Candidatus Altiarchaeales archaeon]|nr:methyltransferase domain-containing protein [Candidatus Altiarchaeales archaeon]